MAPGGAEFGPRGTADDCADDDVGLPLWAPCEHPVIPDKPVKPVATTTVPHSRGR
jgi:hypothetical protein